MTLDKFCDRYSTLTHFRYNFPNFFIESFFRRQDGFVFDRFHQEVSVHWYDLIHSLNYKLSPYPPQVPQFSFLLSFRLGRGAGVRPARSPNLRRIRGWRKMFLPFVCRSCCCYFSSQLLLCFSASTIAIFSPAILQFVTTS